jgi:hypothetical protein
MWIKQLTILDIDYENQEQERITVPRASREE